MTEPNEQELREKARLTPEEISREMHSEYDEHMLISEDIIREFIKENESLLDRLLKAQLDKAIPIITQYAREQRLGRPDREKLEAILFNPDNYQKIEYPIGSAPWADDQMELNWEKVIPELLALIPDEKEIREQERERIVELLQQKEWFGEKLSANDRVKVLEYLKQGQYKGVSKGENC